MAMTLVSTTTVPSGGAASIEFTNIPQTGKDLLVLFSGRNVTDDTQEARFRINGQTTGYTRRNLQGSGSAATSANATNELIVILNTNSSTSSTFSNNYIYISNYTSTVAKSISADGINENNATAALASISAMSFSQAAAVTSFLISSAFDTLGEFSSASLYIIS